MNLLLNFRLNGIMPIYWTCLNIYLDYVINKDVENGKLILIFRDERDEVATSSVPLTFQSPNIIPVVTSPLLPTIRNKVLDYKEMIDSILCIQTKTVVQRSSLKKVFLKISQNSLENICVRVSFLIKLQASGNYSVNYCKIINSWNAKL